MKQYQRDTPHQRKRRLRVWYFRRFAYAALVLLIVIYVRFVVTFESSPSSSSSREPSTLTTTTTAAADDDNGNNDNDGGGGGGGGGDDDDECTLSRMEKSITNQRRTPPQCVRRLKEMLLYTSALFLEHNITHWAMKGTLLGIYRDEGIIAHDYDVDIAILHPQILHPQINEVQSLRAVMWENGFILFQAPWPWFSNVQLIVTPLTRTIARHIAATDGTTSSGDKQDLWRVLVQRNFVMDRFISRHGMHLELMPFTRIHDQESGEDIWIQVLCNSFTVDRMSEQTGVRAFDLHIDPNITAHYHAGRRAHTEWQRLQEALPLNWEARVTRLYGQVFYVNLVDKRFTHDPALLPLGPRKPPPSVFTRSYGYTSWAQYHDFEFVKYQEWFNNSDPSLNSPYCHHTAPFSFQYRFRHRSLWPLHLSPFYDSQLPVPFDADDWLQRYFGPFYMKPVPRTFTDYYNNYTTTNNNNSVELLDLLTPPTS